MFKFLCDQMLLNIGKWLRAAGYDTLFVEQTMGDREILDKAIQENRLLLTRDSHFLNMSKNQQNIIYFKSNSLNECIQELTDRLKLNWLYCPFSRCLICNTPFETPEMQDIKAQVPEAIHLKETQFLYCRRCKKVYWEGSHTQRMLEQLHLWQNIKG